MNPAQRTRAATSLVVVLVAVAVGTLLLHAARGTGHTTAATAGAPAPTTPSTATTASTATTSPPTAAAPAWTSTSVTVQFDGRPRSYVLVRPGTPTVASLPVLVVLHGHSVTPQQELARTAFEGVTGPAVLVYPAGIGESWNAGHCCAPAEQLGIDDAGFVADVLSRVLTTVPGADPSRVYLAGYSNGAKLALTIACNDPAPWRAVAVYGATRVAPCPDPPAVSMMVAASTGDPELTIGPGGSPKSVEGFVEPTVEDQVASARSAAGCPAAGTSAVTGTLTTTTWTCPGGRRVELALYAGGDHGWPAGSAATPSGAAAMWAFLTAAGA